MVPLSAAWMALINLFNLLPVIPLDGGRVVKSITCSIGSRTGLVAVIAGMLLGAVLAVTADLWIFVILIPLGLLDYLYDSYQVNQAAWRPKPRQGGMRASLKPGVRLRCEPQRTSRYAASCPKTANASARMMPSRPGPASPRPSRRSARVLPRLLSPATRRWRYCCGCSYWRWVTSREPWRRCTPCRAEVAMAPGRPPGPASC
jgi:hypothetical protein